MHQTLVGKKVEEVMGHTSTCFLQQRGPTAPPTSTTHPEIFPELTIQSSDPDDLRKVYAAATTLLQSEVKAAVMP